MKVQTFGSTKTSFVLTNANNWTITFLDPASLFLTPKTSIGCLKQIVLGRLGHERRSAFTERCSAFGVLFGFVFCSVNACSVFSVRRSVFGDVHVWCLVRLCLLHVVLFVFSGLFGLNGRSCSVNGVRGQACSDGCKTVIRRLN